MNINRFSTKVKNENQQGVNLTNSLPIVLLVIVSIFILYPIIILVISSFSRYGHFSLENYKITFASSTTFKAFINTLKMALITLTGTWIAGGFLAFVRHKTDFKYKKTLDNFVFLSFTIPAYILSISWIEVLTRGGYLNRILKVVFPTITYRFNAYTIFSSAIILILHLYPLVYYGVGNALKLLNGDIEQAARVCGIARFQILIRVILPLVMPSFISTGLLVISRSMANFGVPAQVSLPTGNEVLTTRIFSSMSDLNLGVVAVLSVILILIAVAIFLISEKFTQKKYYNVNADNKNINVSVIKLGKWKQAINIAVIIFFVFSVIIPFITIIISSFFKRWGLPFSKESFTISNYVRLFSQENLLTQPLFNSLIYGIVGATIASLIASLIVYLYVYRNNKASKWLMNIAQLPIAVPNMILAVAAMFAWINEPFKLYGTSSIIVITYIVLFIPICIKQMLGSSENLDKELDKAAITMNINIYIRYTKLFLPQIKDSLLSGFLICFLISLKEIPISLLLYTSTTKTLGVMMFTVQSNSYGLEMTSTISVIVIFFSFIGHIVLKNLGSKGY